MNKRRIIYWSVFWLITGSVTGAVGLQPLLLRHQSSPEPLAGDLLLTQKIQPIPSGVDQALGKLASESIALNSPSVAAVIHLYPLIMKSQRLFKLPEASKSSSQVPIFGSIGDLLRIIIKSQRLPELKDPPAASKTSIQVPIFGSISDLLLTQKIQPIPSGVDQALRQLASANIAFNTPTVMSLDNTAIVRLVLSRKEPIASLMKQLGGEGYVEGVQIKASDRMEAKLVGGHFTVAAITPEIQAISEEEPTEWKWEIKAQDEGRHKLYLSMTAHLNTTGVASQRTLRTFERLIMVEVKPNERAVSFLAKNWQWLLGSGGFGTATATFIWGKLRKKKSIHAAIPFPDDFRRQDGSDDH